MTTTDSPFPTLFIPHGGGPCFFMDWTMGPPDTWNTMELFLKKLCQNIGRTPKAILVISAHWETSELRVSSHPNPPLFYDYYGFPEHTYQLSYKAQGSPELAVQICELLQQSNISCGQDFERGLDHGVFIPLKLIYPNADIPIVCLSLNRNLDPAFHISVGQSLEVLRHQNILILGSGMSYHNMQGFMSGQGTEHSRQFDSWLTQVCESDSSTRNAQLMEWHTAPSAHLCHPRAEHLIPLMVVAGAAGYDVGKKIFTDEVMGLRVSAFQFGSS